MKLICGHLMQLLENFQNILKKNNIKYHIINFSSIYGSSLPDFTIYDDFKTFTSFEYFFTKNNITLFTKYYAKYLKKFKIRLIRLVQEE